MRIFLIAGKAGSGKTEVAKLIKEYYIYKLEKCVITEYSKTLKTFTMELTDWDGNPNTKPRKYMQELGDKIRSIDEKYFINNMIDDIKIYAEYTDNLVVGGVRLPAEIEDVKLKLNSTSLFSIFENDEFPLVLTSVPFPSTVTEKSVGNMTSVTSMTASWNVVPCTPTWKSVFSYFTSAK